MPVNILITFIIGSILGWILVVIITRAPKNLEGLIISVCSAGNLPIIIIPAICKDKGSPFGDPDVCYKYGMLYASLSMAVFEMKKLKVHNWKLANGAMPYLQHLLIDFCRQLDDLPNELWSLIALRQVHVLLPSEALSLRLKDIEMKDGCELIIREGVHSLLAVNMGFNITIRTS
ncbi:protein PIN-LIKES 4 isoform X2 [Arachis hypogaea]|uniref:protein PIN-LIKES 4 isoform X2 n=1 Tax=Arachis hypogaea TaxID=3818 RepID=UPI000DECB094|nr:protein PIN-LIKES 4 isoform X2 [Arachis hypogaea]